MINNISLKEYLLRGACILLLFTAVGCGQASNSSEKNNESAAINDAAIEIQGEVDLSDNQLNASTVVQGKVELFKITDEGEQESTGKTADVIDNKYTFKDVDSDNTYVVGYRHGSSTEISAKSLVIIDDEQAKSKKATVKTSVKENYIARYLMKELKKQGLSKLVDKTTLKTFVSVIETVVTQLVASNTLKDRVVSTDSDIDTAVTEIEKDNGAKAVAEEVAVNRVENEYDSKKSQLKEVSKDISKTVLESEDGRFIEERFLAEDGKVTKSTITMVQTDGQKYIITNEYDQTDTKNERIATKKIDTPKKTQLSYTYSNENKITQSDIALDGGRKVVNKFASDGTVDVEEFTDNVLVKTKKRATDGKEELRDIFDSISDNQLATFKLYIESKDKLTSVNKEKKTPLYAAIEQGRLEMVDLLIKKSVNLNKKEALSSSNDLLKYPLYVAVKAGHEDIAKQLLKNGAKEQSDKGELLSLVFDFSKEDYRSKAESFIALFKDNNVSKQSIKEYLEKDFKKLRESRDVSDVIIDTLYNSISQEDMKGLYTTFKASDIFYTAYLRKRGLDLSFESDSAQQELFERSTTHLMSTSPVSEKDTKSLMSYLVADLDVSPDFQDDSSPPLLFKISQKPFADVKALMSFFIEDLKADIATKNKSDNRGLLSYLAARQSFPDFHLSEEKVSFLRALGARTYLPHSFGGRPLIDNVDEEGKVKWTFEWEPVAGALKYEIKIMDPDNNTVHTKADISDTTIYKLSEKINIKKLTEWTWTIRPFVNGAFIGGKENYFDVAPTDAAMFTKKKSEKRFVTTGSASQCPTKQSDLQFSTINPDPYNIAYDQIDSSILQLFYDDVVYCVFAFVSNTDHLVIVGYDKNKDKTVRLEKSGPRYIKDILIHKEDDKIRFIGRENKFVDVKLDDLKVD